MKFWFEDFREVVNICAIWVRKLNSEKELYKVYSIYKSAWRHATQFSEGTIATHRITAIDTANQAVTTKGDANDAEDIHYKAWADGVKHFKETEEGREIMCESVKEFAKEYADEQIVIKVEKLMEIYSLHWNRH